MHERTRRIAGLVDGPIPCGTHEAMMKKMLKNRKILQTAVILAVLLLVVFPAGNAIVYEAIFSGFTVKEEVPETLPFETLPVRITGKNEPSEIEGMLCYASDSTTSRGVIVFSPGIRASCLQYAPLIDDLVRNGYTVFTYDYCTAASNHLSGLPEAIKDLDEVLNYLKEHLTGNLPVTVMGHSLGAYASGAVLKDHPEVAAAVLLSPFDKSSDMLKQGAERYIGPLVYIFLPYVRIYERIKFGKFSDYSVTEGARISDCPVRILFGSDDATISPSYGFDKLTNSLKNDPDVSIERLDGQGHTFEQTDEIFLRIRSLLP